MARSFLFLPQFAYITDPLLIDASLFSRPCGQQKSDLGY